MPEEGVDDIPLAPPSQSPQPTPTAQTAPQPSDVKPTPDPLLIRTKIKVDGSQTYMRMLPPSRFAFYDFDDIQIRQFSVPDMFTVTKVQASENLTMLIDLIAGTATEDVRDLTVKDFYYLMYTQRHISYPRTPFKITWPTRYGNRSTVEVKKTDIITTDATISKHDFQEKYTKRGLCIPTVRDWELLETETLSEEMRWTYERAQYVIGDSIEEKVERLYRMGTEALELIPELTADCVHGVNEELTVIDPQFSPVLWLGELRKRYVALAKDFESATKVPGFNQELVDYYNAEVNRVEDEINDIENKLQTGTPVLPTPEKVTVKINLFTFFPTL